MLSRIRVGTILYHYVLELGVLGPVLRLLGLLLNQNLLIPQVNLLALAHYLLNFVYLLR